MEHSSEHWPVVSIGSRERKMTKAYNKGDRDNQEKTTLDKILSIRTRSTYTYALHETITMFCSNNFFGFMKH